jgi:hypothetical protein
LITPRLAAIGHRLLGASILAAVVVVFVRCGSSDDSTGATFGGGDSGANEVNDTTSPAPDGGKVGTAMARVLAVVHAADAFDFRVCFATSDDEQGTTFDVIAKSPLPDDPRRPMPQANYPGIARGNGAVVDPAFEGTGAFVIPFLVNALSLTTHPNQDCKALLSTCGGGSSCLKSPADFVKLPALPRSTFDANGTTLLAVTGSGATLGMKGIPLDGFPPAAPAMGGQLAHLAPTLARLVATYGAPDGGGVPLGRASFGEASAPSASLPRPADGAMDLFGTRGVALANVASSDAGDDASIGSTLPFFFASLAEIQQASDPSLPPNELFRPGVGYVFVVVGDPAVSKSLGDGGANPDWAGRGLHVIAIRSSAPEVDAGPL